MMRSNMYMMQQQQQQMPPQQMPQRAALYARQQGPIASMESMQHSSEWRHLLMSQQQNTNFNTMRPNFQQSTTVYIVIPEYFLKISVYFYRL